MRESNLKRVLKTVLITLWLSVTWAGIASFASLHFLGSVGTIYILVIYFIITLPLSLTGFVGTVRVSAVNKDSIYGFELSVIMLAASSFLGIFSIEKEATLDRHKYLEGEVQYYYKEARRDISDALKTICSDGVASERYCTALALIEVELKKGSEEANLKNVDSAYQLAVEGSCCAATEQEPLRALLVSSHLYKLADAKHFVELSNNQLKKQEYTGDEMFNPWVYPALFKLFLLFLGATAASLQFGITSRKYAESFPKTESGNDG